MSPAECINWQEYTLLELERSSTISLWKQPSHNNIQNVVFECSIISLQKRLHGIAVQNCRRLEFSVASVFSLSYANCESAAPNSPNVQVLSVFELMYQIQVQIYILCFIKLLNDITLSYMHRHYLQVQNSSVRNVFWDKLAAERMHYHKNCHNPF